MILTLDQIKEFIPDAAVPASLATGTVDGKRVVIGDLIDGNDMTVQLNEVGINACAPGEDEAPAAEASKRKKKTPLSALAEPTVADVQAAG